MGNFSKEDVKEFYKDTKENKREIYFLNEDLNLLYITVRENLAEKMELFKKDGSPNISKIKDGILKKAVEKILHQKNKLKEDLDLMESFIKEINSAPDIKKLIETNISNLEDDILANKEKLKKITDSSNLDKDIQSPMLKIVTEEVNIEESPVGEEVVMKNDPGALKEYADLISELKAIIKD